jgi:hypothetical protein
MARRHSGSLCKSCGDVIQNRGCALRCSNSEVAFGRHKPCAGEFHLECWAAHERFESALPERRYRHRGLRLRESDAEMLRDTFICELCMVRSQVGDEVPEGSHQFEELLVLERKRQLSICAAKADSTVDGHRTGIRKIRLFEDVFGLEVVPKLGPRWPAKQPEIRLAWVLEYSQLKMVVRKKGEPAGRISAQGLANVYEAYGATANARAIYDETEMAAVRSSSKSEGAEQPARMPLMRTLHRSGFSSMVATKTKRPVVLTVHVILDVQQLATERYLAARQVGDARSALRHALLCWYAVVNCIVGYRPWDVFAMTRREWRRSAMTGGHKLVIDGRLMKKQQDHDHVVGVPSETKSGLRVTLAGARLMQASVDMFTPQDEPMSSGLGANYDSSAFLRNVLRPALAHIRDSDYPSSEYLRSVDISDVNIRSFRRTATKAMRKAGVEPGMINFIQQWKPDKNEKMIWHYDSVDATDTMEPLGEI